MKSIWVRDYIDFTLPSVGKNIKTPLLIIGGGLAGLMCAYELMQKNIDFILVDAKKLGRGVSANTTAQVSLAHDKLYHDIQKCHGETKARAYLREQIKGLAQIKKIIKEEKIACDYHEESTILGAIEPQKCAQIDEMYALINKETTVKMVKHSKEVLPFNSAIEFEKQIIINPVKYLNGIIRILQNKKIKLYENSKVTSINKQAQHYEVIINEKHVINTNKIIMACHYPFLLQNFYFTKIHQSCSYATTFKTKLKLKANYVSLDAPYYYLRTYDKNTLIIGGADHFTGANVDVQSCYDKLKNKIDELSQNATILSSWFTEDCMPLNYLPYVCQFSKQHPNIILVTGFQKWGFTNAHAAALQVPSLLTKNKYQPNSLALLKNSKNYLRMLGRSIEGLFISKIFLKESLISEIPIGSGKALRWRSKNILVYRTNEKEYIYLKNKCTHMGCSLIWNDVDKVWLSKCHGTIYDKDGTVIYGPGIKNLEKVKINF